MRCGSIRSSQPIRSRSNDTAKKVFYISKQNDIMPYGDPAAVLERRTAVQQVSGRRRCADRDPLPEHRYASRRRTSASAIRSIDARWQHASSTNTVIVNGTWGPITFRDVNFSPWTPTIPGSYFIRAISYLAGDEQPLNDTLPKAPGLGKQFEVRYEIEIAADNASPATTVRCRTALSRSASRSRRSRRSSTAASRMRRTFRSACRSAMLPATLVYDRTVTILADHRRRWSHDAGVPELHPAGSGTYCVTALSNYSQEPVRSNDTVRWCFNVKPALSGTIRVGFGERFRTIQRGT